MASTSPLLVAPLTPLQTAAGVFLETDARAPGSILINLDQVLAIKPGIDGMAICVFGNGYEIPLAVTYQQVRDGIVTGTPATQQVQT